MLSALLVAQSLAAPISFTEGIGRTVPPNARIAVRIDPIDHAMATDSWKSPIEGGEWTRMTADANGNFSGPVFRGGVIVFSVESVREEVRLLEAQGHSMVYVNGEPRMGNPYSTNYGSVPVKLKAGKNEFVFAVGRGGFRGQLLPVAAQFELDVRDATFPDIVPGAPKKMWASLVAKNSTENWAAGLTIECGGVKTSVGGMVPLSSRKLSFQVPTDKGGKLLVRLLNGKVELARTEVELRSRDGKSPYKKTFLSQIDNSAQYFGFNPSSSNAPNQSLILSLHGASVEGIGQAEAYSQKDWAHLVAPTNRRPYGFNWEDIGRLDALEVLEIAQKELKTDPRRTILAGHSMGGHGTWHLGVHYSDLWSAIIPCAGWVSYWSYAGGAKFDNPNRAEQTLFEATSASDTLAHVENLRNLGVFIWHGQADDNVPVSEAETMAKALAGIQHPNFKFETQEGAGHWFDLDPAPGADSVDAPRLWPFARTFSLMASSSVKEFEFKTTQPGVSGKRYWVTVEQQQSPGKVSSVVARANANRNELEIEAINVVALTLRPDAVDTARPVNVVINGHKVGAINMSAKGVAFKNFGTFRPVKSLRGEKTSARSGGIKSVFNRNVVFVIPTAGTPEMNQLWLAKARFDAEQFWMIGNSGVEIVTDKEFLMRGFKGRNVLAYGAVQDNLATQKLIPATDRLAVQSGEGAAYVRPRKDDELSVVTSLVAYQPAGVRLLTRLPLFTAGAGMPDYMILPIDSLVKGTKAEGLRVGNFDNSWKLAK